MSKRVCDRRSSSLVAAILVLFACLVLVATLAVACGDGTTATTAAVSTTGAASTETSGAASTQSTAAVATTQATSGDAANDPYVIGLLTDLSGPLSFIGVPQRDGIQVMIDRINAQGGINGHPLKMIIEDEGSDAAKATAATTKLIESAKVDVIVGGAWGVLTPTIQAICERAQIVHVYPGPPDSNTREQNLRWSFQIVPGQDPLAQAQYEIARTNGYKAIVGIGDDQTLYQASLDVFGKLAAADNVKFTRLTDTFTAGAVDLSSQAQKIEQAAEEIGAEAVVITCNASDAAVLIRNLNKLGVDLPVIGTYAYGTDATVKLVGDLKSKVYWPDLKALVYTQLPASDPQKPILAQMADEYKKLTGSDLNSFAANNYSTVSAIAIGLAAGGHDHVKMRDAMETIKGFVGSDGTVTFNSEKYGHESMTIDGMCVLTVENGAFKLLGTFSVDGKFQAVQ